MNIRNIFVRPDAARKVIETQALTEEGRTYFDQVLTEYRLQVPSQNPTPDETEIRKIADPIAAKPRNERTWGDLFALEITVVKLQSEDALRRGAWAIRTKYKDLVGEKTYEAYQSSNPPDPKTGDINQLRCDTLQILAEFHWAYAFAPLLEKIRSKLTKQVFVITTILALTTLALAALIYYRAGGDLSLQVPLLAVVIAFGMLGGFISLQQRIQSVPSTGDPIVNIADLANSQFSLYLAPISGAVFAVLLYIIFIGGLLAGPLFPTIHTLPKCAKAATETPPRTRQNSSSPSDDTSANHADAPTGSPVADLKKLPAPGASPQDTHVATQSRTSTKETAQKEADLSQPVEKPCPESVEFSAFLKQTGPDSGGSFAMLLVWSFIAGFAERFVPDTIDRLVSQAQKK
jgi:hypothetical protein